MPSLTVPSIPHYTLPPITKENLDYADLPIIDLSKADTSEGRAALARQVCDAMTNQGFFYIINHGLSPAQSERIFDIADVPFAQVDDEEKQKYAGTMKQTGSYQGYKLRQYWHVDGGVRDQIENYNINRDVNKRQHPEAVRPLLPEISQLMALGLELPEDTLVNMHGFDTVGESYVRFMKYYPRSEEDELNSKNVWLKGHTDFGTITILYSQPVSALQIFGLDGRWRWIKHIENALVVNAGDAMEFLSGGFYRGTIHRVVQPPIDQRTYTRLSAFYFAMPDDNVKLAPLLDSPVLQRVGIKRRFEDGADVPTVEQWRKARTSAYGQSELKTSEKDKDVEEEFINGVLVKHYN
ncbi:hypothetical protein D9758_009429 [Tetrapyrgos nigripes]|uniref:Fe2OG dioxygenase domain-containing protein n=1 Tax=Tetrapyrgos nigripes TaxID=182062 RepID=A0A8H5FX69_9AGAR|nr:hypothetical protein D9758_009429 [Tetrapyrgos nigripes]